MGRGIVGGGSATLPQSLSGASGLLPDRDSSLLAASTRGSGLTSSLTSSTDRGGLLDEDHDDFASAAAGSGLFNKPELRGMRPGATDAPSTLAADASVLNPLRGSPSQSSSGSSRFKDNTGGTLSGKAADGFGTGFTSSATQQTFQRGGGAGGNVDRGSASGLSGLQAEGTRGSANLVASSVAKPSL